MRVAIDDHLAVGEKPQQTRDPSQGRPGIVYEPDPDSAYLDNSALGKALSEDWLVHVPAHSFKSRQSPELVEHRCRDDVAGMQDQVGTFEAANTPLR